MSWRSCFQICLRTRILQLQHHKVIYKSISILKTYFKGEHCALSYAWIPSCWSWPVKENFSTFYTRYTTKYLTFIFPYLAVVHWNFYFFSILQASSCPSKFFFKIHLLYFFLWLDHENKLIILNKSGGTLKAHITSTSAKIFYYFIYFINCYNSRSRGRLHFQWM